MTLHSLRHTFASWLAIAGLPLRPIQELLGHKSIVTTERYSHLGGNGRQPYYTELARAMAGGFVVSEVTPASGPLATLASWVPNMVCENLVINSVFTGGGGADSGETQVFE